MQKLKLDIIQQEDTSPSYTISYPSDKIVKSNKSQMNDKSYTCDSYSHDVFSSLVIAIITFLLVMIPICIFIFIITLSR
jgi:subtilase family serine protease